MAQAVRSDSDCTLQARLHKELLFQTSDILEEIPGENADEKAVLKLGSTCITNKIANKEVTLPNESKIRQVFDRIIGKAIQDAAMVLIANRQSLLEKMADSHECIVELSQSKAALVTTPALEAVKTLNTWNAQARDEIKLLQEWSQSPMRMFTDPLKPS